MSLDETLGVGCQQISLLIRSTPGQGSLGDGVTSRLASHFCSVTRIPNLSSSMGKRDPGSHRRSRKNTRNMMQRCTRLRFAKPAFYQSLICHVHDLLPPEVCCFSYANHSWLTYESLLRSELRLLLK